MIQTNDFHALNASYWEKRAPGYSAVNKKELATEQRNVWRSVLSDAIRSHFGSDRPLRVLDVGTGPGFFAILLTEIGHTVTAIDYTENMLREARANANHYGASVEFFRMNAEALDFESQTFDVVVSRNVTWNLKNPEAAYGEWTRVLKSNGLLLNFDANWYRYLKDETRLEDHIADRERVKTLKVEDDQAGTDVDAMERIARETALVNHMRPGWDEAKLAALGMQVSTDTQIWRRVWTEEEYINNASTPMFMIRAVKSRTN